MGMLVNCDIMTGGNDMAKMLVTYYSRSGNTAKMAESVAEGAIEKGAEVVLKPIGDINVSQLQDFDALIIGSPTYYGLMCSEVKKLIDDSVKFHGKLKGKVGGAFSTAANPGGGSETTVMSILQTMIVHGMVVQGTPVGDHYGPTAVNAPDERAQRQCRELGNRIAELAEKLHG